MGVKENIMTIRPITNMLWIYHYLTFADRSKELIWLNQIMKLFRFELKKMRKVADKDKMYLVRSPK